MEIKSQKIWQLWTSSKCMQDTLQKDRRVPQGGCRKLQDVGKLPAEQVWRRRHRALIFMYRCFCGDVKNEHFLLPTEILLEIGLMANTFLCCTCPQCPFHSHSGPLWGLLPATPFGLSSAPAAFHRKKQFLGREEVQGLHRSWLNLKKRRIKV